MKTKILILTTSILLTIAFIYGCKKESGITDTSSSTEQNVAFKSDGTYNRILDSIGIIHNQGLEHIFNKIKDEKLFIGLTDSAEVISLVKDLTVEYLNSYYAYIPYSYSDGLKDSILNTVFANYNPAANYSTIFNQKMEELMNEYNRADNPREYKNFAMTFLEENLNLIPENEQPTFKAAILVSFNSWEYWNANMGKWINEYRTQNGIPPIAFKKLDARACGKADIKGCIQGAIGGAFSGGLVGACLGAPLGAIGGSAWDAIWQGIGF